MTNRRDSAPPRGDAMNDVKYEAEVKKAVEVFDISVDDAEIIVYSRWRVVTLFRLLKYEAMPAIALLIAKSDPKDKDLMVNFVMGLFA